MDRRVSAGPVERRFLREALLSVGGVTPGLPDAVAAVRDWNAVEALAAAGSVRESVFSALRSAGLANAVPEPTRGRLQEAHTAAVACNAELMYEAVRVQEILRKAGVESIALKGTALLAAHYPDLGARHVGDVDLLVREEGGQGAEVALRAAGFRDALQDTVRHDGVARGGERWSTLDEVRLESSRGVPIDLQVAVAGQQVELSDVDGVFERSRVVRWQGRSLRIPGAADLAAGLCLHVFAGHPRCEPFLPRHLADLAVLFAGGSIGWDDVARVAPGSAGRVAIARSRRLLEVGDPGWLAISEQAIRVRWNDWKKVALSEGAPQGHVVRLVFPAREYMAQRYGVSPTSPWLPLLYAWRPLRGIWGLLSGK